MRLGTTTSDKFADRTPRMLVFHVSMLRNEERNASVFTSNQLMEIVSQLIVTDRTFDASLETIESTIDVRTIIDGNV